MTNDRIPIWYVTRSFLMMRNLATAVIIVGLLTSNAAGQKKYQRPAINTPDSFRGTEATAPDQNSIGDLKWFEVFKDEELQKLVRTAMIQNYDLRAAVARINAEAQICALEPVSTV